ncbi:MAG: glycosyltransferase family 39 protein, partial [Nitrospirales bacterium]
MVSPQATSKGKEVVLLVLITIIGTGLRIYRLGYQSLWYDEILTVFSSHGPLAHVLFQTEFKTNILPFYYLVTHAFMALGNQEYFVRIPAVIFGALTIPLLYYSVRQWFDSQVALWSSVLLALSPFHIFYSQEARPYTMFVFLCLLTFYLLQLSLENKDSRLLKLGVAVVGASTFYCHITAIPFLGFLGICVVILVPQNEWRKWIPTFLGMGILLLPALYRAYTIQVTLQGWQDFDPQSLLNALWAFSTGFSFGVQGIAVYLPESLRSIPEHF